ncbi:hypothetical protein ECZU43_42970 [Escherichia coli]|nr:hypothetical protein ECZU43_42970 [Escherichia coli]
MTTVIISPARPAKRRLPAAGRLYPEQLAAMLEAQTLPLTEQGMSQLLTDNRHDFLLRLAHTLAERGITHWQTVLKPLLAGGAFLPAPARPDVQPAACRRTGGRTSCVAAVAGLGRHHRR